MNILELVSKYGINLVKQGDIYVGFCSFHNDTGRPNLTVYPKTDSYYCFSCNIGGDVIDFFSKIEKISRVEATRKLYNNLQFLIDKINHVSPEVSYNEVVNLQISRQFRNFLYNHPERILEVKKIMKYVDEELYKEVNQDKAVSLIKEVNTRLNQIL